MFDHVLTATVQVNMDVIVQLPLALDVKGDLHCAGADHVTVGRRLDDDLPGSRSRGESLGFRRHGVHAGDHVVVVSGAHAGSL